MTALSRQPYQRYAAVTLMGVMVTLLVTACGESQVAQCNKLIEVINKGQEVDQDFEEDLAGFEGIEKIEEFKVVAQKISNTFSTIEEEINSHLEDVEAIQLSDEELVAYQESYIQEVDSYASLMRETSNLFGEVDDLEVKSDGDLTPENAQKIMDLAANFEELDFEISLQASNQRFIALNSDINTYCGVNPDTEDGEGE
ncbi:MAG: hypothetical protein ACPGVO_00570 [Spirulinaceae cyanobacterium]